MGMQKILFANWVGAKRGQIYEFQSKIAGIVDVCVIS